MNYRKKEYLELYHKLEKMLRSEPINKQISQLFSIQEQFMILNLLQDQASFDPKPEKVFVDCDDLFQNSCVDSFNNAPRN